MKMTCFLALSSLALLLAFSSCHMKGMHIGINDELKKRFWYKNGDYWIYKDVASGNTDSIVVADNSIRTDGYSDEVNRDIVTITLHDYNVATQQKEGTYKMILENNEVELYYLGDINSQFLLLRWPLVEGDTLNGQLGRADIVLPQTGATLSCWKQRAHRDTFLVHDTHGLMKFKVFDSSGQTKDYSILRFHIQ